MKAVQSQNKAALLCRLKLSTKEDKPRRVSPSVFTQEILQSTEERLSNTTEVYLPRILEWLDMSRTSHRKRSLGDMDQPLFQPYPSELVFQNFTPAETYKLPLLLLNNDKVSRQVKLKQTDSDYFHVLGPEEAGSKVAPGMSATFTVLFTPQENKDYHHTLVCVTERERFEIPILAIGPRAILDFRDNIHLPICPVKASTEKTHLVRNIGNRKANFKLHTQSPFSVTPSAGTLEVGESVQVTVIFHPMKIGDHRDDLLLHYHTGEDVYIALYGSCEELNIHLKPDEVLLKHTYISMASVQTVSLTNDSDVPLQYHWTGWSIRQEEDMSLLRESSVLQQREKEGNKQPHLQCGSDPTAIHHLLLLSRALQEQSSSAKEDHLQDFLHRCITVDPVEGEIWPHTTAQFIFFFRPDEAKLYQQTMYFHVTGRESSLPLKIKGEGLGPNLQLNYNLMDMKNIFIGDKDHFEVKVSNKGRIDAPFKLSSPDTTFGRCFSFSPLEGVVPSEACQIVKVTFHCNNLGSFSEDLLLTVTGQPRPLVLTVRGCVIGPTFHFNVSELNFGDVAFGFPLTSICTLFNTSYVPMNFALRVSGDGLGSPSISSAQQASDVSGKNWQGHPARDLRACPVEFTVNPAAGSLRFMSDIDIKVTLCSNTVRSYRVALVVDVEGVGEEIMALPINARCVVPEILVETPVLDFQRCFLNHPYELLVQLTNPSNLPACYGMLDQEYEENSSVVIGSSLPRGVILPGTSEKIPVLLLAKAVGRLQHALRIAVFGNINPPLEVIVSCIGQGPVVHVQSAQLQFGKIPVLKDISRDLHLFNKSPIPARFTARLSHGRSFWRVEPSEGEVPPGSRLELKVVAHLKDTLNFQDQLEVSIQDSNTHTVPLSATGTGTTIVSDTPFGPSLDLGTHFCHESSQFFFKLSNLGRRVHRLHWKTDGNLPFTKTRKGNGLSDQHFLPPIHSTPKPGNNRGSSLSSGRKTPVFNISPTHTQLFPGCSVDMVLTGSSDCPKVVQERLVLHGRPGQQTCQEKIMTLDVVCRFVATVLSISPKQLHFHIKKVKGKNLPPMYEKLILKNTSSLSLSMNLSLGEPFYLCEAPGDHSSQTTKSVVLGNMCQAELWVCFNPSFYEDQQTHIVDEALQVNYKGHPQEDVVPLHAEVHYPNLHFSSTAVDFGCVVNCTETRKTITITNCSQLLVSYCWAFMEDQKNRNVIEEKQEQKKTEGQAEESRASSATLSPAFSFPRSPEPVSDEHNSTQYPGRVEKIFDIIPMYGHLQPGEQQQTIVSFYGHENINREVVAQCHVEDGPTYNMKLRGEASVISYSLDSNHLDFGLQLFDKVCEIEVNLRNTGKVGFKFRVVYLQIEEEVAAPEDAGGHMEEVDENGQYPDGLQPNNNEQNTEGHRVRPGWPLIIPAEGYIAAGVEQLLRVLYLPGIPEVFQKKLQLQVSFSPHQDILLTGVGVFPRISLDLPRNLSDQCYSDVVQQARASVEADRVREELVNGNTASGHSSEPVGAFTYEELLHMEIERLLVKENALTVSGNLLGLRNMQSCSRKWLKLSKLFLPEYVLDFGNVILGKVISHTAKVTNSGSTPVSFYANSKHLAGTGFAAEFVKVKNLPCGETHTFTVKFHPQGGNGKTGDWSALMPIQIMGGPVVQVRLCAVVTIPAITVSMETLQFDTLQCGMCQVRTLQLVNNESVPCQWSIAEEVKPFKKVDKFLPPYIRKKVLQEQQPPPTVFEMVPCSGTLYPGQRINVHIRFSPTKQCAYNNRLVISVAESTQQVFITAQGQGEEPRLQFCASVLELEPCIPASTECEAEVTVKNPCSFPIEFYSLEFDTQYLEEEKILRMMKGYDENNILLLPPRTPGEGLPTELLDYYKDYCSQLKHAEVEATLEEHGAEKEENSLSTKPTEIIVSELGKSGRLGELEMTPVSRAIARHVGVDLTPEGQAARYCKGIAIIVYGAPQTDKSSMATALASHYGVLCLSVDAVVTDTLINGNSPLSLTARQVFDRSAAEFAQKDPEKAAQVVEDITGAVPPASLDTGKVLAKQNEDSPRRKLPVDHLETNSTQLALYLGGNIATLRNVLPEQLLVGILSERFQSSDCHRGIILDGLQSVYTQSAASTLQIVLKALNNRKHIYVVNVSDSYAALKAREKSQREAEEALQNEKADRAELWLQELDEEEYDALPEEKKEKIVRRHIEVLQQQKIRVVEQMAKEEEEKKQQEMKRLKDEELLKKSKKGGKRDSKEGSGKKKSLLEGKQSTDALNRQSLSCAESKESLMDINDDSQKQTEEPKALQAESPKPRDKLEKEKIRLCSPDQSGMDMLQCQFNEYEQNRTQVEHILQYWDRAQGLLLVPLLSEEATPRLDDVLPDKQSSVSKKQKKGQIKAISPLSSQAVPAAAAAAAAAEADQAGDKQSLTNIIPHIVLNVTEKDLMNSSELIKFGTLPPLDEVLDELGLGPSGPPIPPPIIFSMVPLPRLREQTQQTCFTFLVPSGQDEQDEETKEYEEDLQASSGKEDAVVTAQSRSKCKTKKTALSKDKDKKSRESKRTPRRSSSSMKTKGPKGSRSALQTSPSAEQHQLDLKQKCSESLSTFRWVVPAGGEVVLRIWFYSESTGSFEQTFNFELVGNQRHYQLICKGFCSYPSISKDYMTLFPHSKKVAQMEDGLEKAYVINSEYFEFGPLLCSKTRDGYKTNRYPENTEKLVIHNNTRLKAEIQFQFQHDTQATTYILNPSAMTLKPNQKQELTVWAYPTNVGRMEDSIVCHIKNNPEPVTIRISCWGALPELVLESKRLHFDRIITHRRESQSMTMHNKTVLSVSWRVQGVEELGDDFSVSQDEGIIPPNSSFVFSLHLRAKNPFHMNKVLRLEVSDVEKTVEKKTENIQVLAEAYHPGLSLTPDGYLNFGTIRVSEEVKMCRKIKNSGKYPIAYKFHFEQTEPTQPKLDSVFKVSPQSGTLKPHEEPTTVQIICSPEKEVFIQEQPILYCQVIEPNIGNGGETIATLAIKISVQSVFSRFKITPACDINFGQLVYGYKKTQSFTIKNTGVFETSYKICRMTTDSEREGTPGGAGKVLRGENLSGRTTGAKDKTRRESLLPDINASQQRLNLGQFTVHPCMGSLPPGSQQMVTVDCPAEQLGNWNHGLLIDVSGRDPKDHPDGIPYRLLAEVCRPGIALDMTSIFEEHHLCLNSSQLTSEQFCNAETVFIQDENKFLFKKVLVDHTATARFKLTNISKVPCVLSLSIKYPGTTRHMEIFDLSVSTLSIPSQSHTFAVITFKPQSVQLYSALFEATMEGPSGNIPSSKGKMLEFDLMGEGTMPSVCVVRPALRDSRGRQMLQFRRVLVGRRHTLPLVLLNDGNVPAHVHIDMLDKHGVFTLKAVSGNTAPDHPVVLNVNESVEFEVGFSSDKPQSVKAKMSLWVEHNKHSNTTVQLTAEAYQEIVSLSNISRSWQEMDQEDDVQDNYEMLNLGDCHVDVSYQESFTMTNHSINQVVRFEWPASGRNFSFSPQVGHLHAGCFKEVKVTFISSKPVTYIRQPMKCKIHQVEFQQPLEQVADWDDRPRMVQWLSSPSQALEASQQSIKNKVITTDPEPNCSVVEGTQWELDLRISAVCDYVKFSCSTDAINFKDTLLFQTRLHQLQIANEGKVKVDFAWQVLMDQSCNNANDGTSESRPGSRSGGSGPRPSSALASVMSLLMGNPELPPFDVEPNLGTIEPGAVQKFSVHFSPVVVAQFHGQLLCSIPNVKDGDKGPCILVSGRSLLPHCYFDLEDSDYIIGNRHNRINSLDPHIRVLEFSTVGLAMPSKRLFTVLNPTSKPYSFKWKCEDKSCNQFHCLTPCGTILPGKKAEVCFEYVPEQQDVVESVWSFVIETLSLSIPFLCVGTTREPHVYLNRPHLDLGELLVGRKVEKTVDVVNAEEEPFNFSVLQSSIFCEDQQSSLILKPMTGRVAPKDRLSLSVTFTPTREGYVSFRLVLKVKKKLEPLFLTVKADCFTMSASVQVEKSDGVFEEITPNQQETLNFREVGITEQFTFNFLVSNLARSTLEVRFDLTGPQELLQYLEAVPQNGTIEVGMQLQSSLFFCPRSICDLQDVTLNIKVKHGPIFTFAITGEAVEPSIHFSFTKFNFGKCFLFSPGTVPPSQTLVISNKGKRDISIQSQFKNTDYLQMEFQPDLLCPGAMMEAPITFYPREAFPYHEKLTFILNSSVTKQVDILGQGVEMMLEVEDPRQKKLKLGCLTLGQKAKKQVVLINRSSLSLSFTLMLSSSTLVDPKDLSFSPAGQLKLKSNGGSCNVEIQFSPRQHVPAFTAELQAEFTSFLHPLLTISGCCQGVEVTLDKEHLSFGAVVQRCHAKKKIIMINSGDIGARFQWKTQNFPAELSIKPAKGYLSPGMDIPFEVTFAPLELSNDSRYENLSCVVEGSPADVKLTVTGSCIAASTNKEVVKFVCPVRSSHTQTLFVLNPTNEHWRIRPVIEGHQWRAARTVTFEPRQKKAFEIIYRPLTMTNDERKHLGSVFFSFPDGTAMLYSLQGTADPPKAEDTIVNELPAKTLHSYLLPVHNWLSRQQRFRVVIETIKPDKIDATVSLKGLKYLNVPALAKRDYKISFLTYKEGQFDTKVTFCNEETGEYLFYSVTFKATSPGVSSTIQLETTVRQIATATIEVENPLSTSTCLTTECKCPDITAPHHHTVPGLSKGFISFKYQPLQVDDSTTRLTLSSPDLGHFHYHLVLKALPPPPEKTVYFNTSLGSSHSVAVKVPNYSRSTTKYSCKTDSPEFLVDKYVRLSSGSESSVEVCFEPHQLGDVRGHLTLSSEGVVEYIFPLHGVCLPPKAQGPFIVKSSGHISIPFKNVFLQTTAFSFQVNNPCFTVKGGGSIVSKKNINVQVSFEAPPESSPEQCYGRLTISSQRSEGHIKPCSWVYYLKGLYSES